jgi:ribulose-5-phosphate 4-epimerase/fuculose-1-phosphate aldolase
VRSLERIPQSLAELASLSPAEWRTRRDLAACYRLTHRFGMSDLVSCHISARIPNRPRSFLINQFGLLFDEVTASNLVEVDLEGRVLGPEGARINPAGLVVHTAIYDARPDVACVLHTHSSAGAAVSMLEDGLLPVSQFALQFYDHLAYHDYEGIILDDGERDRLVDDLGNAHAMILRNHGLLTVGRSVGEAFTLMHNLEQACEVQLRAMSSGARLRYLSEDLCRLTARQHATFDGNDIGETEWAALMRDIERTAPECLR